MTEVNRLTDSDSDSYPDSKQVQGIPTPLALPQAGRSALASSVQAAQALAISLPLTTPALHGIPSRTAPALIGTEVVRLNAAVRGGSDGRFDYRDQPADFAAALLHLADSCHTVYPSMPSTGTVAEAAASTGSKHDANHDANVFPFGSMTSAADALRRGETTSVALTKRAIAAAHGTQQGIMPLLR